MEKPGTFRIPTEHQSYAPRPDDPRESSLVDDDAVLSETLAGAMAEMFRALADSNRAKIVHALIHRDMTTSGLADLLAMSQPSVSQHLRLLRMLRIVRTRREGRLVIYSLDDAHIRLLVTLSLSHLREAPRA